MTSECQKYGLEVACSTAENSASPSESRSGREQASGSVHTGCARRSEPASMCATVRQYNVVWVAIGADPKGLETHMTHRTTFSNLCMQRARTPSSHEKCSSLNSLQGSEIPKPWICSWLGVRHPLRAQLYDAAPGPRDAPGAHPPRAAQHAAAVIELPQKEGRSKFHLHQ